MLPALIAAGSLAAKAAPYVLTLAPLIAEFFSGKGSDEQAAAKISEARDGLAARLAASEGISMEQAKAAVDEHLKPLIEQHAEDSAGKSGGLVSGAMAAAGGVMLGRGMGKAAGLVKGAVAAEKAALPAEAAIAEEALSPTRAKALESVRDVGRLDSAVMASKRQGLPVISGKQEQALSSVRAENRMTRQFNLNAEVPSAGQRGAASDVGLRGKFGNEDMIPGLDQSAAVEDIGGEERWKNMLAREEPGINEVEEMYRRKKALEMLSQGYGGIG